MRTIHKKVFFLSKCIKEGILLLGLFCIQEVLYCQLKYANNWLLGYDTMNLHTQFSFSNDSLEISTFKSDMDIDGITVMSNSTGNLQFYTNGCQVFNAKHRLIQNGDNITPINWGSFCSNGLGILLDQSALAIPLQDNMQRYILTCCAINMPRRILLFQ